MLLVGCNLVITFKINYFIIIMTLKNKILFIPNLVEYLITLNLYNGDITGLPNNIEYSIWYFVPLLFNIFSKRYDLTSNLVMALGGLTNIYWYYANPWNKDSNRYLISYNNENYLGQDDFFNNISIVKRPRHRTEFYISHGVLASYLFSIIIKSN